ncbi:hypothetical protein [Dorea sp. Marseille-P4042]|nr:hypothetical protein [Dorea sp. Marseille-P4042]
MSNKNKSRIRQYGSRSGYEYEQAFSAFLRMNKRNTNYGWNI